MKASLVSATSLLALLVFDLSPAHAGPAFTLNQSLNFGDSLINCANLTQCAGLYPSQLPDVIKLTSGATATFTFTGPGSPFAGSSSPVTLPGNNESVTRTYTFSPVAAGAASQTVTVVGTNGSGSTAKTVTLNGTGVAPVEATGVTVKGGPGNAVVGNSVNLGAVLVSPAGSHTASASITVKNTGNGNLAKYWNGTALVAVPTGVANLTGSIGASGAPGFKGAASAISLSGSGGSNTKSAVYTYTFAPTATGTQSSVVTATFADGVGNANGTGSVAYTLTGTGVAPVADIADSANAGYVLVNSAAHTASVTVTITNTGNGNLAGADSSALQTNLHGVQGKASSSVFTGSGTIDLTDSSSHIYTYNFAPKTKGAVSATVTTTFANGVGTDNGSGSVTTTLTGTGVAPVESVTSGEALGRVNASGHASNASTGTAALTVTNIGNGNLSGLGSISNLNASSISVPGGSVFTAAAGNPTSLSLADSASATLAYTFAPTTRGAASAAVTIGFTDGNSAGTNSSQTLKALVTGLGVSPVFQSSVNGHVDTAIANGGTAHAGTIDFGTVARNARVTLDLAIANISSDPNGGNPLLTDLSVLSVSSPKGGTDPMAFSIGSVGSLVVEGGQTYLPITVATNGNGLYTSYMTIGTDQNAPLGVAGDTFTYEIVASVPEPGSMLVLGAGLLGLGVVRRRPRGVPARDAGGLPG